MQEKRASPGKFLPGAGIGRGTKFKKGVGAVEQNRGNWWLGLVIIALGVIFLLGNFELVEVNVFQILRTYWPVVLLLLGFNILTNNRERGGYLSALIFILLGLLFLGRNLDLYYFELRFFWRLFWPVVLILLGVSFLRGPQARGRSSLAFMGSVERSNDAWTLESGSYWAIMGGVELDLRRAVIAEGEYYLNCHAIMGGVEITVPPDLTVYAEGTAILGGVEFMGRSNGGIFASAGTRQEGSAGGPVVHIYGRALLGAVEVKVKGR